MALKLNRRDFLATASALAILPCPGFAAQGAYRLRAEAVREQILPKGDGATAMLGFNGTMPGPELRVKQGARINVEVENGLDEGTAVHWHGIRLDNRMDGVPVLTQDLINPGAQFQYGFVAPDAGTYWYHSHYISHEQVARGMIGALIVEEDTPPDVDADITVIISDWWMNEDGSLVEEYATMHSVAHAGYMGNFARAFLSKPSVQSGDRVRFRLINAATNRVFPLRFGGALVAVVALDGMPLSAPRDVSDLTLAPAQRADIIVDMTDALRIEMETGEAPYLLGAVAISGTNATPRTGAIAPLPSNPVPALGAPTQHLTLAMMGGAMGGAHGGDNIWAFNNVSDLHDAPFASFAQGETARITLVNDTAFAHGIHLHGHHFHELGDDGALGDLRDTTLVAPRQTRDILCVFDNPGRWMLHCHMLSHAVGGMRTWVEVT